MDIKRILKSEGVMRIGRGGAGSEANVVIELRTKFPGIGGTIITQQAVPVALREEFSKVPKQGHKMFLKHAIIKKLEDYFQRKEIYKFPHIPRPLGSISRISKKPYEAYIYEWAFGSDNFPWGYQDLNQGFVLVKMHDWSEFGSAFDRAGIDLTADCTDADDGRISQNVIHQLHGVYRHGDSELNALWKRIDFGALSIRVNYDKLKKFLYENEKDLRKVLRSERYDMMALSFEYLTNSQKMDRLDIGRLDSLIGNYRLSSLRHHVSRGTGAIEGPVAHISSRNESLV